MSAKPRQQIPLPPKTQATLREMIEVQRRLQGQIDAIVSTARDLLAVPDDYVITDVGVGFVPPPVAEQPAGD